MATFQDSFRGGGNGYGAYILNSQTTAQVPLTIKLYAGQVANGFEIKNSLGTTIFSVSPTGSVEYTGSETITDALTVTGATHLLSTLEVDGTATFDGAIIGNSTATFNGATTFNALSNFNNLLEFDSGASFTAGNHQFGRNSSDHLQYNVPLTKQHQFTVEDTVKMSISSTTLSINDNVVIAGTTTINGSLITTGSLTLSGVFKASNGTAAAPSYTFAGDPDTGFYWSSSGAAAYTSNGVKKGEFGGYLYWEGMYSLSTTTLTLKGQVADGATAVGATIGSTATLSTAGAKIVSFVNNTTEKGYIDKDGSIYGAGSLASGGSFLVGNGGVFANSAVAITLKGAIADGATAIGTKMGNTTALTVAGAKIVSFYSDNVTTERAAIGLTGEVMAGAGTALLPSHSFLGDPNTGEYSYAADTIGWSTGGTVRMALDTVLSVNTVYTLGAVSHQIRGGIADGASAIGVKIGNANSLITAGAKIASFYSDSFSTEKAYIDYLGSFNAGDGTVLLPAYSFVGDPNSGFYKAAGDDIRVSLGGVLKAEFAASGFYSDSYGAVSAVGVTFKGAVADGASAIANTFDNTNTLSTAGAKIASFKNNTTEKAFIDYLGSFGRGKTLIEKVFYTTVTLDTGDAETAVGLTPGGPMISAAIRVSTQITGLDSADHHIKLGVSGTTAKYIDVAQGGAATTIDVNKKGNSAWTGFGTTESSALILTIDGGADNIPTAGAVEVEIHYWALSDLPSV